MTTYNDIKKHLNIKIDKHLNDGFAHLTHFWQNNKNGVSEYYKLSAKEYLQEEILAVAEEPEQLYIPFKYDVPFPPTSKPKFKFIDLFAGIGGFRMAMQNLGGKCVFSSEWDVQAQKTYLLNYGEVPFGDITKESTKSFIPDDFDILCAGFPCQAFSIAGKRGGFEDTRGTLFFDLAEIIKRKQPKAIFLENVKGLRNHNGGKTLATILNVLRNDLGYFVPEPQIINAKDFGVPQNRERIYIVGFRNDLGIESFEYPKPTNKKVAFSDIKENYFLGVPLGRAFRSNLFVRSSQKGFPLQSLTQKKCFYSENNFL